MKINYFLLLILLDLVFSTGCAQAGKNSPMSYNMDVKRSVAAEVEAEILSSVGYGLRVSRVTDNKNQIICYVLYSIYSSERSMGELSCLPLSESN